MYLLPAPSTDSIYARLLIAAAEVVVPIVARWKHGDAYYRFLTNRAFEHIGHGSNFSIQHVQDNQLNEALGRFPDTITKESPWKQAI